MPFDTDLPIKRVIPDLLAALQTRRTLLLEAPTGSGKTTVFPLNLLSEEWLRHQRILLLEPRRLAARSVAQRMAEMVRENTGETIGYRIRFERKVSSRTRVEVMTEGLFPRIAQDDPGLDGIGAVIFDEFHERSLSADLSLGLARDIQGTLRPDLRIIIMSATLDLPALSRYLPDAAVVRAEGRSFPVDVLYEPLARDREFLSGFAKKIEHGMRRYPGDCLAFLPGVGEIRRVRELLHSMPGFDAQIAELSGELDYSEQRRALAPFAGGRKVILSTPIAQTSVTVEGITLVVDGGLEKVSHYDTATGFDELRTERIARDAADQRAGRAGRTAPGVCIRCWAEQEHNAMRAHAQPEIVRGDLLAVSLELAAWGCRAPEAFQWLTVPPIEAARAAWEMLLTLKARDEEGRLTALGKRLIGLGLHPRLGMMAIRGAAVGLGDEAAGLIVVLDERTKRSSSADLAAAVEGVLRSRDPRSTEAFKAYRGRIAQLGIPVRDEYHGAHAIGLLLAFAYPERVGVRVGASDARDARYLLAQGKRARIATSDLLSKADAIVVSKLYDTPGDAQVLAGAEIVLSELERFGAGLFELNTEVDWNETETAVVQKEWVRLGAIRLNERTCPAQPGEAVAAKLLDRWMESDLSRYDEVRLRLETLRAFSPALDLAGMTGQGWKVMLRLIALPSALSATSLSALLDLDLVGALEGMLTPIQREAFHRDAPRFLRLANGRERRVEYDPMSGAYLELTVQEAFGWRETPKLGRGVIPLTVRLLSPARRPVQVTRDLAGFWRGSYPQVRKELRGRYPKHHWPEDPFNTSSTG
jgi:ATP-dependent helicase HrpB